jgi:hypothetical protein
MSIDHFHSRKIGFTAGANSNTSLPALYRKAQERLALPTKISALLGARSRVESPQRTRAAGSRRRQNRYVGGIRRNSRDGLMT